ncbi:hypothetical protein K2X40_01395 [Candidatus Babeliales bacterium]|nr:hypothetical protein [Candidatus Babeliales bacterium]
MKIYRVVVWSLVPVLLPIVVLDAEKIASVYKKVGDELVAIRQAFPESQPKVYRILDHVDQLYKKAKSAVQKREELAAQLAKQTQETEALQKETAQLKQTLEKNQQELARAQARLEQEKARTSFLAQEEKKLLVKEKKLNVAAKQPQKSEAQEKIEEKSPDELLSMIDEDDLQNLNLTSTSDPRSPR